MGKKNPITISMKTTRGNKPITLRLNINPIETMKHELKKKIDSEVFTNSSYKNIIQELYDNLSSNDTLSTEDYNKITRKLKVGKEHQIKLQEFIKSIKDDPSTLEDAQHLLNDLINANLTYLQTNLNTIIQNTDLKLNDGKNECYKSKFIICTYWWGRGNNNRNYEQPCPGDQSLTNPRDLTKNTEFSSMIDDWKKQCKSVNCNFIEQEYPQFTIAKGYQAAINAKPLFIKKALEYCKEHKFKGVVYIDGDMSVNVYPHIFDMDDIDYMARGWNMDPRSARAYLNNKLCFDPLLFETSGGIMYFGNTVGGYDILEGWIKANQRDIHQGKADDRIISLLLNYTGMFLRYNIIQLPIEYLWLTDIYGSLSKDKNPVKKTIEHFGQKDGFIRAEDFGPIIFEHPACLTSEEAAADQGASNDRSTILYNKVVEGRIACEKFQYHGQMFYEHIYFDDVKAAETYKTYSNFMNSIEYVNIDDRDVECEPPIYRITYDNKYGLYNEFVQEKMKKLGKDVLTKNLASKKNIVVLEHEDSEDVLRILKLFMKGYSVVYKPKNYNLNLKKFLEDINPTYEFVAHILERNLKDKQYDFKPYLNFAEPMMFSNTSKILRQLLAMSCGFYENKKTTEVFEKTVDNYDYSNDKKTKKGVKKIFTGFNDIFNSSYIFVTRIRCKWLDE